MSATHAMSAEDLWKISRDGGRHELVRGELRTMPPAGAEHGFIIMRIAIPLGQFVNSHQLGAVFGAETGFKIGTNPDTVRAPDGAFLTSEKIREIGMPRAFWPGPPDLAVEVVSPGDTVEEVDEKVADLLAAGTRAVWIVKPRSRTVTIYEAADRVTILAEDQELDGGSILPGFRLRVSELFVQ